MNEQEWLDCTDAGKLLFSLQPGSRRREGGGLQRFYSISPRKLRLFAVAVHRHLPINHRSENYPGQLENRVEAFADREDSDREYARSIFGDSTLWLIDTPAVAAQQAVETYAPEVSSLLRCNLLREIVNPYYELPKEHSKYLTEDSKALAQDIYTKKDWTALPILADMLEEAGWPTDKICRRCKGRGFISRGISDDGVGRSTITTGCQDCMGKKAPEPLLLHLRHNTVKQVWSPDSELDVPFAHQRGCWGLDTILGLI